MVAVGFNPRLKIMERVCRGATIEGRLSRIQLSLRDKIHLIAIRSVG